MIRTATKESIDLDFKRSDDLQITDRKRTEISKDISAFANSAGGTLIYGMLENGHIATGLDTGSDPNVITKEWLELVITSTIHRRIDSIRINQVELKTSNPGRVTYVVYVPQSTRTPHQASDKRFYKRFNFLSAPMEEYEVRDLYRRGEVPDLRIAFNFPKTEVRMNQETGMSEPFGLNGGIFNDAVEPANYAIIRLYIDARLKVAQAHDFSVNEGLNLQVSDMRLPITCLSLNWGIPSKMPIFQQQYALSLTNNSEPFLLRSPTDGRLGKHVSFLVGYEISAPRMPQKSAFAQLHVISGYATLSDDSFSAEDLVNLATQHSFVTRLASR
jgi:hypothetical protein